MPQGKRGTTCIVCSRYSVVASCSLPVAVRRGPRLSRDTGARLGRLAGEFRWLKFEANGQDYFTDSNGLLAFGTQGELDQNVNFSLSSYGYTSSSLAAADDHRHHEPGDDPT